RLRIFFAHELGQRTSEWERGDEPMTGFSFTGDYDAFGQPRITLSVAVPRGRDPRADILWPERYLAKMAVTGYAASDAGAPLFADRVAHTTEYELTDALHRSVTALRDVAFALDPDLPRRVIGQTLHFYDGPAFTGLPLGRLGATGAKVRSEELVITPDLAIAAYGQATPPWLSPSPDWTGYPAEFAARVGQAGLIRRHAAAGSPVVEGWYAPTMQQAYDFQRGEQRPRGLVRRRRDPLGNETHLRYDRAQHLVRKSTDAAGLVTRVKNDYRLLKPRRVRDANGARSAVAFTPLGRVEASWNMGRRHEGVGDTWERPSSRCVYDFHAYAERGQPVSVRTIRRVHHAQDGWVPAAERDETVESIQYSDGNGRVVQTRTQGPDVVFGDPVRGEGVLTADRSRDGQDVAGTPAPAGQVRVIVSGWQRFDNKGRPVESWEPFFAWGWAFAPATEAELGRRTVQEYEARGRVARTIRPDGSEQRVVFGIPTPLDLGAAGATVRPTPWESYTYAPNDNAGRTHPAASAAYAHHRNTPASTVMNALANAVTAVARTRDGTDESAPVREVTSRSTFDIRGRLLEATDALGRTVGRTLYDLAGHTLRHWTPDTGDTVTAYDAAGRKI
ncbi:MAG TPA: hypothetical protein VF771_10270, partial [Longimicrobiaceae bacterium]